jgi:hypothetical protein
MILRLGAYVIGTFGKDRNLNVTISFGRQTTRRAWSFASPMNEGLIEHEVGSAV